MKKPEEFDGVISRTYQNYGHIQAFATVKGKVDGPTMRRFYLAMKSHLHNKNHRLYPGLIMSPIFQWYIIFEMTATEFEEEFSYFLEYLRQSRVITKPKICDFTKPCRRLK